MFKKTEHNTVQHSENFEEAFNKKRKKYNHVEIPLFSGLETQEFCLENFSKALDNFSKGLKHLVTQLEHQKFQESRIEFRESSFEGQSTYSTFDWYCITRKRR